MQVNSNPTKERETGKSQYKKTVLMTESVSRSPKKQPVLKTMLILVLLDTGSSDDLIFIEEGLGPFIPIRRKKGGHKTASNGACTQ